MNQMVDMREAFENTMRRWKIPPENMNAFLGSGSDEYLADRMANIFGISLGLGCLFNEDADAERDWLRETSFGPDEFSAMDLIIFGDVETVKYKLDLDRNLL